MMSASSPSWSEKRQQSLHEHLHGLFAFAAWHVGTPHMPQREPDVARWLPPIYRIVADAYDARPEIEKDIWDMHKMGLEVNPASTSHHLNFTRISQPWLRDLAKEYMRYNVAVHSPGDCLKK